jgi:3-hydroxyisobutyrate dehydrogenase
MKIGFCGMGKMGSAMARRLLSVGHEVTVWNRDASKTAPLVVAGATRAETPAVLAQSCHIIISMLLNADALEAVYGGADGVLAVNLKAKLVIDMSTVLPETEESLGGRVMQRGGAFVECPVGGTVGPAAEGKLFGFVGGRDEDVARAMPVLQHLCRRIEHVGPVGAGAKLKLAVNLPLLVAWQALGEALALCQPLKLEPARLLDILADTSGATAALKGRGPSIARALAGEADGASAFATMVAFGQRLNVTLPATSAALAGFDAAIAAGHGADDATTVAVLGARRVQA